MLKDLLISIRSLALLLCLFAAGTQAQVAPMLPDLAQVARTKALAQAMTVAPTDRTRDAQQVLRVPSLNRQCSMSIGATPGATLGHGLAPMNTTVLVQATPVLVCGM